MEGKLTIGPASIPVRQLDAVDLVHRIRLDGKEVPQDLSDVLDDVGVALPNFLPEGGGRELATDDDGRTSVPGDTDGEESGGRVVEGHGGVDSRRGVEAVESGPHLNPFIS